jgi:hypothetical protein
LGDHQSCLEGDIVNTRPSILGIDPGGTVGIASYTLGKFYSLELPFVDAFPYVEGVVAFHEERVLPLLIVPERYVVLGNTGKKSAQPDALKFIGALENLVMKTISTKMELQPSAEPKKLAPDRLLREVRWHKPGKGHANDAARHVCYGLLRHWPEEWLFVREGGTIWENTVEEAEAEEEEEASGTRRAG